MSARFNYTKSMFGNDYTKRQNDILNGDVPFEEIRTTELTAIKKKALARGDDLSYTIADDMFYQKTHPDKYIPKYTLEEAKAILQKLRPWKIDWGDGDEDDN